MPGKNPDISQLQARKQLLIAESNLNREQLIKDMERITTIASLGAGMGLMAWLWGRKKREQPQEKVHWWAHLLKSVGLLGTLWKIFSRHRRAKAS